MMRYFIGGVIATLVTGAMILAIVWFVLLPRLNWGAGQEPGMIEQTLSKNILARWVRLNANSRTNHFSPTPENLKLAQREYEEHCAVCHGLDGSGRNRFEADFYPPVAKLTGSVQKLSDSEIYFIVASGIRNTAMPAFGKTHSPDDMWRAVLWVRHLANLTPGEKVEIEQQVQHSTKQHEETMQHGIGSVSQPQ